MSDWTKEPWWVGLQESDAGGHYITGHILADVGLGVTRSISDPDLMCAADAQRIVACVNALAGIDDPAGFMRKVAGLLRVAERSYVTAPVWLEDARALLAKLPGGAS